MYAFQDQLVSISLSSFNQFQKISNNNLLSFVVVLYILKVLIAYLRENYQTIIILDEIWPDSFRIASRVSAWTPYPVTENCKSSNRIVKIVS